MSQVRKNTSLMTSTGRRSWILWMGAVYENLQIICLYELHPDILDVDFTQFILCLSEVVNNISCSMLKIKKITCLPWSQIHWTFIQLYLFSVNKCYLIIVGCLDSNMMPSTVPTTHGNPLISKNPFIILLRSFAFVGQRMRSLPFTHKVSVTSWTTLDTFDLLYQKVSPITCRKLPVA